MFRPVDRVAIKTIANRYSVPAEWAFGLAEVESAGRAFWTVNGKSVPAIRPEGHYFYRHLSGAKRAEAVRLGLASKKAGGTKVPNSFAARYQMLDRMMRIDHDAALMSISMGVGQVMGAHWRRLGFKSVLHMWDTACESLSGQVELMLRFVITDDKLFNAVKANQYSTVAKLYNGPAYKRNSYHTKIKAAVEKYRRSPVEFRGLPQYDKTAEMARIKKLGYETVQAFQQAHGLDVDGIIGPITREAIERAVKEQASPVKEAATVGTCVATGAGGLAVGVEAIEETTGVMEQAQPVLDLLGYLGSYGPTIAAVAVGAIVLGVTTYVVIRAVRRYA